MITAIVNGKEIKLESLTVERWLKVAKLDMSVPEWWPKIVATALGIDEKEVAGAPLETLELAINFIRYQLEVGEDEGIEIGDLDAITFGQWIDMDIHFHDGLSTSLALILKKWTTGNEQTKMPSAIAAVKKISQWRSVQYRAYADLLMDGADEEDEDVEESHGPTPNPRMVWYNVLVRLANEDVLQMNAVTELPFRVALNFLNWKKSEAIRQQQELQKLNSIRK